MFHNGKIHGALRFAFVAVNAGFGIQVKFPRHDFVGQRDECADGAHDLAEGAADGDGAEDHGDGEDELRQLFDELHYITFCYGGGDHDHDARCGAEVAEEKRTFTAEEPGDDEHGQHEEPIFKPVEERRQFEFPGWNFVEQILQKSDGADPAAKEASNDGSDPQDE